MRIRKYANQAGLKLANTLSSTYLSNPHTFIQPHICQLNQSPWDVISFPPDSASSPYQVCPLTLSALTDLAHGASTENACYVNFLYYTFVANLTITVHKSPKSNHFNGIYCFPL